MKVLKFSGGFGNVETKCSFIKYNERMDNFFIEIIYSHFHGPSSLQKLGKRTCLPKNWICLRYEYQISLEYNM